MPCNMSVACDPLVFPVGDATQMQPPEKARALSRPQQVTPARVVCDPDAAVDAAGCSRALEIHNTVLPYSLALRMAAGQWDSNAIHSFILHTKCVKHNPSNPASLLPPARTCSARRTTWPAARTPASRAYTKMCGVVYQDRWMRFAWAGSGAGMQRFEWTQFHRPQ